MFKLLRFYSITSFIVIFATAALLTLFYRQVTMQWIEHLARTNNLALAQTVLNPVGPELAAYLGSQTNADKSGVGTRKLPAGLAANIRRMAHDTEVGRIEIYDRNGQLIFSTHTPSTTSHQERNPAFLSALNGSVSSSMIIRDIFNRHEGTAPEDNQMHTYTPIRNGPSGSVLGVFETHSDMSHLTEESDRVLLSILTGAGLILALLYTILFLVVRHARNIITAQQKTILDRTASLKILSEDLLEGEETRKKKIAFDLHEGLAQTLSAIKVNVESDKRRGDRRRSARTNIPPMESIVPVLQSAIHEVRTIATELRPSSLDDLGLLPTLNWFFREFERQHPGIRIQREISLPEGMIPSQLKIVIYRIIESAFRNIAKYSSTDQIRFVLRPTDDMIHLIIGDTPATQPSVATIARFAQGTSPQLRFAEMKERTSLSGGEFSTRIEKSGWVTLHSSWACAN